MSKRQPRLTKKERRALRPLPPLVAADVTGAPEVEALMRGEQTTALLIAVDRPEARSSRGWRGAQIAQTIPYTMRVKGRSFIGRGVRMAAVPGSRILFDEESASGYRCRGPVEIAVDDDGRLRSARVSSPDDVVVSVVRVQASDHDHQEFHARRIARALARHGDAWEVVVEDVGGRGVSGDAMTDALLTAVDGASIRLQMVELHADFAQRVGHQHVVVSHTISSTTIRAAIDFKNDFAGKDAYELVLCCPFDLGAPFRHGMSARGFDTGGWRRVWLSDASDEPVVLGPLAPVE